MRDVREVQPDSLYFEGAPTYRRTNERGETALIRGLRIEEPTRFKVPAVVRQPIMTGGSLPHEQEPAGHQLLIGTFEGSTPSGFAYVSTGDVVVQEGTRLYTMSEEEFRASCERVDDKGNTISRCDIPLHEQRQAVYAAECRKHMEDVERRILLKNIRWRDAHEEFERDCGDQRTRMMLPDDFRNEGRG